MSPLCALASLQMRAGMKPRPTLLGSGRCQWVEPSCESRQHYNTPPPSMRWSVLSTRLVASGGSMSMATQGKRPAMSATRLEWADPGAVKHPGVRD